MRAAALGAAAAIDHSPSLAAYGTLTRCLTRSAENRRRPRERADVDLE
jgi:hypothetical protein